MNIGKMDRRIILEAPTHAPDSFGQAVESWAEVGRPWARVDYKAGDEQVQANELVAVQRVEFTIRYDRTVTPRLRVRYQDQVYNIDAVAEIGRRLGTKLTCYTRNDAADAR